MSEFQLPDFSPKHPVSQRIKILRLRRFQAGTMLAWVDIELASGLQLLGGKLHEQGRSRWYQPPSSPARDRDDNLIIGDRGKPIWTPWVSFRDTEVRRKFSHLVCQEASEQFTDLFTTSVVEDAT